MIMKLMDKAIWLLVIVALFFLTMLWICIYYMAMDTNIKVTATNDWIETVKREWFTIECEEEE